MNSFKGKFNVDINRASSWLEDPCGNIYVRRVTVCLPVCHTWGSTWLGHFPCTPADLLPPGAFQKGLRTEELRVPMPSACWPSLGRQSRGPEARLEVPHARPSCVRPEGSWELEEGTRRLRKGPVSAFLGGLAQLLTSLGPGKDMKVNNNQGFLVSSLPNPCPHPHLGSAGNSRHTQWRQNFPGDPFHDDPVHT